MRLLASLALVAPLAAAGSPGFGKHGFAVISGPAGPWPAILSSIGLQPEPATAARVLVARPGTAAAADWPERIEQGTILILEGESSLAESLGFHRNTRRDPVRVQSLTDDHGPELRIIWEKGLDIPFYELPEQARVFARDRWSSAPVSAGFRQGAGAVLWIAAAPGEHGYERFPYLLNALADLGLEPPFRSDRLWAFFDGAYRSRVDLDYFAARWRKAGIAALHVAAWHNFEPDTEQDVYLRNVIDAAHRQGILVYAWLELPHVSEKFWNDHPEWREKTATGQDAQLDWRKLMNLANRDCFRAVSAGVQNLIGRFDWDGVNLAELYFESLEGPSNPSRFTPLNSDVRLLFKEQHGIDPIDKIGSREFLEFRAGLARRMQEEWLGELERCHKTKPYLDFILTHIDDQIDTGIRDALGADAAASLRLLDSHNVTFLVEDPATVWNLAPQRYRMMAERYLPLTTRRDQLAIDINIAERYQDVYPTRQQTGVEFFQLVHAAAVGFPRVALYAENSLVPADLGFLPYAAAAVNRVEQSGSVLEVESPQGVGVRWAGDAKVDGVPWPARDGNTLWIPAGRHAIEPAPTFDAPRLVRLTADLKSARVVDSSTIEFAYQSRSRAIAILDRAAQRIEIDGIPFSATTPVILPRGEHTVIVRAAHP
jgi:hypothetical protein